MSFLLQLFCSATVEGRRAIVLELVAGGTLLDALGNGPLSLAAGAHIAGQLFRAVNFFRRNNIIHRDLKSGNILLGPGNRVVVSDFDLCAVVGQHVATNTVVGTAGFYSPEQAMSAPTLTSAADTFGAACVYARTILPGDSLFPLDGGDSATLRRRALTAQARVLGTWTAEDERAIGAGRPCARPTDRRRRRPPPARWHPA